MLNSGLCFYGFAPLTAKAHKNFMKNKVPCQILTGYFCIMELIEVFVKKMRNLHAIICSSYETGRKAGMEMRGKQTCRVKLSFYFQAIKKLPKEPFYSHTVRPQSGGFDKSLFELVL